MVHALGPVAMTCLLVVASASACGESGSDVSSSTASTASTASSTTDARCPDVPVVVAAKDIPAGTTGAEAAANGMLREDQISARYRPATAVTSLDQVSDAVVIADLVENEIVSFEHFGLPTDTTLAPAGPSCSPDSPPTTAASSVTTPPGPEDAELIRAFLEFAADPSPTSAARVPFAAEVSLGLADTIHGVRARDALADEGAWSIPMSEGFRGYVGPFSALETAFEAGDDVVVSVGPHAHCASPPVPPPEEAADLRRISVQPTPDSIDTCIKWWTVDLFLTPDGEVAAVTLDLWEP